MADCIFCTIVSGATPSYKVFENQLVIAILYDKPVSKGHVLVIPKQHAEKMHQLTDETLAGILPVAKKVAVAMGIANYNIIQNNGELAYQEIMHAHFHIIPKPDQNHGIMMEWNAQKTSEKELQALTEKIVKKIA